MVSYKLEVKSLEAIKQMEVKEYEIIIEEDNIRCTCEYSSLHPEAYKLGQTLCNHIQLFIKLPKLFEKC